MARRHKQSGCFGPLAALVALVVLVLAGDPQGAVAQQAQPSGEERTRELGVVGIQARIGGDEVRSSGVVIDADDGLVLTNAHTIWGAKSIRVATGVAVLFGRIVARDACDDLAVVELQPRVPGLAALIPGEPRDGVHWVEALGRRFTAPVGAQDTVFGIPAQLRSASATRPPRDLPSAPGVVALDSTLLPEASGAALLDREGAFWGMAQVIAPPGQAPRAYAIPGGIMRARLDELEPGPRTVFVGWRERHRCAPRLHAYNREAHPGFTSEDARFNAPVPATRVPGTEQLDQP